VNVCARAVATRSRVTSATRARRDVARRTGTSQWRVLNAMNRAGAVSRRAPRLSAERVSVGARLLGAQRAGRSRRDHRHIHGVGRRRRHGRAHRRRWCARNSRRANSARATNSQRVGTTPRSTRFHFTSRVMDQVVPAAHVQAGSDASRRARYFTRQKRDLIALGAYEKGSPTSGSTSHSGRCRRWSEVLCTGPNQSEPIDDAQACNSLADRSASWRSGAGVVKSNRRSSGATTIGLRS